MMQMGRLEAKMDMLIGMIREMQGGAPPVAQSPATALNGALLMEGLTTKQHAVLQMMLAGKSVDEMSERMAISPNTTKTHIRLMLKKAGVRKQAQLLAMVRPVFEGLEDAEYRRMAKGLPKDWDLRWGSGTEKHDAMIRGGQ